MDQSNTRKRVRTIDGDEYDAVSWISRAVLKFSPGERARIKRQIRRRERHLAKRELRDDVACSYCGMTDGPGVISGKVSFSGCPECGWCY